MKTFCASGFLLSLLVLASSVANSQGPEGGYYRLTSMWLGDGRSLGADESGSRQIQLFDSKVRDSQFWYLVPESNGYYRLMNKRFPSEVLDIVNDGINNNRVVMGPINNYSGQYWKLTPQGDGTFYRLTTLWLGEEKSLDVVNDGNNREVRLAPTGNYSGQYWKLTRIDDGQISTEQYLEEQNRQQAAVIAQQRAIQQSQRQKGYTVGIDCKGYSTLTNTETNDLIIVTFIDVNGYNMGDQGKAINSCEVDTYFSINGNNIAAIQISTQGSDAFWMDQAWLLEDGREVIRWGKNEGGGYCFSRDPADANGGFKNFISSRGCKDCMRFDITTGEVTECRNVLLKGN